MKDLNNTIDNDFIEKEHPRGFWASDDEFADICCELFDEWQEKGNANETIKRIAKARGL